MMIIIKISINNRREIIRVEQRNQGKGRMEEKGCSVEGD